MYSIEFTETANKQLNKLPEDVQIRAENVLERIRINPFHFVKRKEGTPYFILRIGEYRAILSINQKDSVIYVMDVGHRKNIYK